MSRKQIIVDSNFLKFQLRNNWQTKYFDSDGVLKIPENTDFTLQINNKIEISRVEIDRSSRLTILIEGKNKIHFDRENYEKVKEQINYEIFDNLGAPFYFNDTFSKASIGDNVILLGNDCQ